MLKLRIAKCTCSKERASCQRHGIVTRHRKRCQYDDCKVRTFNLYCKVHTEELGLVWEVHPFKKCTFGDCDNSSVNKYCNIHQEMLNNAKLNFGQQKKTQKCLGCDLPCEDIKCNMCNKSWHPNCIITEILSSGYSECLCGVNYTRIQELSDKSFAENILI